MPFKVIKVTDFGIVLPSQCKALITSHVLNADVSLRKHLHTATKMEPTESILFGSVVYFSVIFFETTEKQCVE